MKLFQSGEGRGSSRGEGSGHVEAALVSTTKDKGNGPRPGRREKKRRRRRPAGSPGMTLAASASAMSQVPEPAHVQHPGLGQGGLGPRRQVSAHGDANLLRPSHESWISNGDTRYENSNLEADATNGMCVRCPECSDTRGRGDQFVQLAVSHNQGGGGRTCPSGSTTTEGTR